MDGHHNGGPKVWQNSKHIRKRSGFLLNNLDVIPTDVTFIVGNNDEPISAHRLMLAMGSEVFYAMFYGQLREKTDVIPVTDVQPHAFRLMLEYLYSEEITGLTMETVMDSLYCAKKYLIPRLVQKCRFFVQENVVAENTCILTRGFANDDEGLTELATIVTCHQAVRAFTSTSFLELSQNSLCRLLRREDLKANEAEIYQAARRWALANIAACGSPDLKEAMSGIIECIRLPLMSPSELVNGPDEDKVVCPQEMMAIYRHNFGRQKPVIRFSAQPRRPRSYRYYALLDFIFDRVVTTEPAFGGPMSAARWGREQKRLLHGRLHLEVFTDVVPECAQLFDTEPNVNGLITYGAYRFGQNDEANEGVILPPENSLLSKAPFWVSMVRAMGNNGPEIRHIHIEHPVHKVSGPRFDTVFARVVRGIDVLQRVDRIQDGMATGVKQSLEAKLSSGVWFHGEVTSYIEREDTYLSYEHNSDMWVDENLL